jgi:protein ImuB
MQPISGATAAPGAAGGPKNRTLVVWCPDWPVVAARCPPGVAMAVLEGGRVLACSAAARDEGVAEGLRRRQAESLCPRLEVVTADRGRDARAFEPVVAAVASFAPRVEVTTPGACAVATRGPSRYFGGDAALAARVAETVDGVLGRAGACLVGVADGPFAAGQAARLGRPGQPVIVPPGGSAAFLAPLPVTTLGAVLATAPALADLWGRLGVRILGDLAALPPAAVTARFGPDGAVASRLARGLDERPLEASVPPPDLTVTAELDPPVESVETASFVAKALADRLCARLAGSGLVLTCVGIEAETEHGERLCRLWRHGSGLSATALGARVRWQLEGWLTADADRPTAGITLLRLVPHEVGPDLGRQAGLWGGEGAAGERAARALARLQGMLGPEAVVTAVVEGARGPAERARLVPWGGGADPAAAPAGRAGRETAPWPGHLAAPAPATVHAHPPAAEVIDAAGRPVGVTGRGGPTAPPARLAVAGGPWADVVAWAGPWPCDERWWDPRAHRRRARWQVVTASGDAHLLAVEGGCWSVEASYD